MNIKYCVSSVYAICIYDLGCNEYFLLLLCSHIKNNKQLKLYECIRFKSRSLTLTVNLFFSLQKHRKRLHFLILHFYFCIIASCGVKATYGLKLFQKTTFIIFLIQLFSSLSFLSTVSKDFNLNMFLHCSKLNALPVKNSALFV